MEIKSKKRKCKPEEIPEIQNQDTQTNALSQETEEEIDFKTLKENSDFEIFPEENPEDMETDVPDAPEIEEPKKNIFTILTAFFKRKPKKLPEEIQDKDKDDEVSYENETEEETAHEEDTEAYETEEVCAEDTQEHAVLPQETDSGWEAPESQFSDSFFSERNQEFLLEDTAFGQALPDPNLDEDALELPDIMEDISDMEELEEIEAEFVNAPENMPAFTMAGDMQLLTEEENLELSDYPNYDNLEPDFETDIPKKPDIIAEKPNRHIFGKLVLVLICIILILVFVVCLRNGMFDEKEVYYMPDLVGKNYYNLQEDYLNYDIQVIASDYSAYEKDVIYAQDIPAGQEIQLGQSIHVSISLGLAEEEVPDVRNYDYAYAQKTLEELGFQTELVYENSISGIAAGNVIRTEPDAEEMLTIGSVVTIYVSQGLGSTAAEVQNVVGKSLDEAIAICEEYGLVVETEGVPSLETENTVIAQSLQAKTTVDFGSIITLTYSNGEEPEGTVDFQLDLPAYANGRFILDFIDKDGVIIASSPTIVAGFSAGSTIPVEGTGIKEVTVILTNYSNSMQTELGKYEFDFTTGKYKELEEVDIEQAFRDVDGIG